ncbi:hypothetical protein LCGC14_2711830 [marine sediment metagenome]|uniref:Uncharacterized protein n=1 Tax=marine sediment metagenome TaxID=412755 RepID=A0A0F9BLN6_9ZZZZ
MDTKRKIKRYRMQIPITKDSPMDLISDMVNRVNSRQWRDHSQGECLVYNLNFKRIKKCWEGVVQVVVRDGGWDLHLITRGGKYSKGIAPYEFGDFNLWPIGEELPPEKDEFTEGSHVDASKFDKIEPGELGCVKSNPFVKAQKEGMPYGAWCLCSCCSVIGRSTYLFDFYGDEGNLLVCERCVYIVKENGDAGRDDQNSVE